MKKKVLAVLLASALALAMAGCGGGGSTAETKPETPAEDVKQEDVKQEEETTAGVEYKELVPVMSYEDFMAADIDSPVTVETYVQAKQSYYEEQSTATLYTQNEEGAYFIYNMTITQEDYDKLVEGQKIKISGYKSEWSGEIEITDATYEIQDGNYIAEAKDVTDLLGKDELVEYQNQKVAFKGLKSVDTEDPGGDLLRFLYGTDGNGYPGDDLYFSVEKDGETYLFTVESYLCGPDTDVYKAVESVEEDAIVDLEGFLYWYEGPNPHITSMTVQ